MHIDELYAGAAAAYLPEGRSHTRLAQAITTCQGCPLWEQATHAVIGRGRISTAMMLVGEQPGDQEDRTGAPFVGPAGRMLDRALAASGIERDEVYVTNVVKHFKWTPSGKRRIHQRPSREEVDACAPWLAAEIEFVRPGGDGAAGSDRGAGAAFRITKQRGVEMTETGLAPHVVATAHPSSILRIPAGDDRRAAFAELVADLQVAVRLLENGSS